MTGPLALMVDGRLRHDPQLNAKRLLSGMGLSNVEIVECLKTTSFNPLATDSRGNYDPVYGWGIVDADRATFHCV